MTYVDVRELDEWKEGHLEGAIFCPLSELQKGIIPHDLPKDQPLQLYCARGRRAKLAEALLKPHYPLASAHSLGFDELSKNV